jgi:hypothetical protein
MLWGNGELDMRTDLSIATHAALLAGLLVTGRAGANTFEVTRGDDPAPDGCIAGDCSLREALAAAETTPADDVIVLGPGLYNVTLGELPVIGEVLIQGAGSVTTSIVGAGDFDLLHVFPLSELTVSGVQISSQQDAVYADRATVLLRDVHTPPAAGGAILSDSVAGGTSTLRIENSNLEAVVGCIGDSGSCVAIDSTLNQIVAIDGIELTLDRVEVTGPPSYYGVAISTYAPATIRDSTIRNQTSPLWVSPNGTPTGDVHVLRTRFIGNRGPMHGGRDSGIYLDDVEFRDNVVDDDNLHLPAVLLAESGPGWRIARALFTGNRGGGGLDADYDGAVVRALAGANVVISNSTFEDNTFRSDINDGFGDTIGVTVSSNVSTLFWLFQTTMVRSNSVPASTPGSLLTVRGATANVRVYNSLLAGTCAFVSGGAMFQAIGDIESPGNTCEFPGSDNDVNVPGAMLLLGSLGDHGGFTETFEPQSGSVLLDNAVPIWCTLSVLDQRRYGRPAAGIGCDIGAVEAGAGPDSIFSDDFE